LLLVDHEGAAQQTILFPILFASILGLPLFISLRLLAERKMWRSPVIFGTRIIGLLLLVGYGFVTPQDYLNAPGFHLIRFLILAAVLHLLVSVAPFYRRGELNGFWHYNKTLFFAVWRRVSEYGVTEGRYLAIALGGWLAGMVAYFNLSKLKSIKAVPATLLIVLLAVSFGPWNIFAVSEQNQIGRLKTILLRDSILVDAKVRKLHSPVSFEDAKQISSIVAYLHDLHGYGSIEPWFAESLKEDSLGKGLASPGADVVTGRMGVTYTNAWQFSTGSDGIVRVDDEGAVDVRDFQLMVLGLRISSEELTRNYPRLGLSCLASKQLDTITSMLAQGNRPLDTLRVDLRQLVSSVMDGIGRVDLTKIPPEQMSIAVVGREWKVKVVVRAAWVGKHALEQKTVWYYLDILYSFNEKEGTMN